MDRSRWRRAGAAGGIKLCRLGRGRRYMVPDTPLGPEHRVSIRSHFQWWDTYTEFRLNFGLPFLGLSYSIF